MKPRPILTVLVLVGALAPATFATTGDRTPLRHQSAIVAFERPTWVATQMLVGTYVIVHDDDRMMRGGPCTALYRVGTRTRPLEEVVSFHCIPRERKASPTFTTTIEWNPVFDMDSLVEYQFAGDSEGHGVPVVTRASDQVRTPVSTICLR